MVEPRRRAPGCEYCRFTRRGGGHLSHLIPRTARQQDGEARHGGKIEEIRETQEGDGRAEAEQAKHGPESSALDVVAVRALARLPVDGVQPTERRYNARHK